MPAYINESKAPFPETSTKRPCSGNFLSQPSFAVVLLKEVSDFYIVVKIPNKTLQKLESKVLDDKVCMSNVCLVHALNKVVTFLVHSLECLFCR